MKLVYLNKKNYFKRINDLYYLLDDNENGLITLNEFNDLIDVMERNKKYQTPTFGNSL